MPRRVLVAIDAEITEWLSRRALPNFHGFEENGC
jgi:hypothetical protein